MPKTADIRCRIEPDKKAQGEEILRRIGLTTSDAMVLFWNQMILEKGLPFRPHVPSDDQVLTARPEPGASQPSIRRSAFAK